jgi:Hemerythrin HHE cation binding domain
MTEHSGPPLADTSDMVNFHCVFRHAFGGANALLVDGTEVDPGRVEIVGSYYDNVLRLLHVHHDGEDELMTPRLTDRGTPREVAEVTRIAAQHAPVLVSINAAEDTVAAWRAAPTTETATATLTSLAALDGQLTEHLDEEEDIVIPIAARYITAPEWGELPGHGMAHFTGDKPWLVIGLIREQMTDDQRAEMDAHMPPPIAEFWATAGEPMFVDYVGKLRG